MAVRRSGLRAIKFEINLRSAERGYLWLWYNVDGDANVVAISMTSTALHSEVAGGGSYAL
jgi:hypothetical protein